MIFSRDCLFCSSRFTARLERRLFCSDICRARYNREEKLRCFYCGELATSRDHIYPHSARTSIGKNVFEGQETVNACTECNTALSDKFPFSIENRVAYLEQWLIDRYDLHETLPEWFDDEIFELGETLRRGIAGKIRQRQRAIERILHVRGVWRNLIRTLAAD